VDTGIAIAIRDIHVAVRALRYIRHPVEWVAAVKDWTNVDPISGIGSHPGVAKG
jgi:hypothetical protein